MKTQMNRPQKNTGKRAISSLLVLAALGSQPAYALDNIIRPYLSARSAAMGGVKTTTGIYDENFYGNPARVTQNDKWKLSIFDFTAETSPSTIDTASDLAGSDSDVLAKIGDSAGKNNHVRIQTAFPALYIPRIAGSRWSYGFAVLSNSQADVSLRNNYSVDPQAIVDVGPAFNVGYQFLENRTLSVGITPHVTYRVASRSNYSMVDLVKGVSLSPSKSGGDGTHLDVDAGVFYEIPWKPMGIKLNPAFSINNLLGGKYSNIAFHPVDNGNRPRAQPRSFNLGISGTKDDFLIFDHILGAFEINDIGNNPNGSIYRLLHLGTELPYGVFKIRLGLNQGYAGGGIGLALSWFQLDLSTYGEEMSLNTGQYQERRYALHLGFGL
jgi:hypothetical protein